MTTISIHKDILAAVAMTMASKDVRYYLMGVYFEPNADRSITIVSADGHRLTAAHSALAFEEDETCAPFIAPASFISAILKGSRRDLMVKITLDGDQLACASAGAMGTCVDGKFPDWRRVIGNNDRVAGTPCGPDGAICLSAAYIGDTAKQAAALGNKYGATITQFTSGPALVRFGNREDIFSAIMPVRMDGKERRDMPAWTGVAAANVATESA